MNDKPSTTRDQIPYVLTIRDADDPATWRAYPAQSTTIAELYRACKQFDLICWVDLDCEVCLIPRDMTTRNPLPDSITLERCLRNHVSDIVRPFPVGPHDRSWCG